MTGWRRPSASGSGPCIEVRAMAKDHVAIRDTTQPLYEIWVPGGTWREFLAAAKAGEFDDLAVTAS